MQVISRVAQPMRLFHIMLYFGHYFRLRWCRKTVSTWNLLPLVGGPCTHDYTRIRTSDHLWTDPSAGELMQRKMIYSAGVQQQQKQDTVQRRTMAATQKQPGEGQGSTHSRPHLPPRPHLSLDMGIGAASSGGRSQPSRVDTPGIFSLHFESDLISPASLLYQVSLSPPPIRRSKVSLYYFPLSRLVSL